MDNNVYTFWGGGEKYDVALSYEDYLNLISVVNDERLSPKAIMKYKNLYEVNSFGMLWVPFYTLLPSIALSQLFLGKALRSTSGYRYSGIMLSFTWPLTCWFAYTTPIPRRLYTEIVTDESLDGEYLRGRLKQSLPGLWRKLSHQLARKGYNFKELNENLTNTEFPLDFVNKI